MRAKRLPAHFPCHVEHAAPENLPTATVQRLGDETASGINP
jgi:hypothetical protein